MSILTLNTANELPWQFLTEAIHPCIAVTIINVHASFVLKLEAIVTALEKIHWKLKVVNQKSFIEII